MKNDIQTITARTLKGFEDIFNKIFPNATDANMEIIENVHLEVNSQGKSVFTAKIRKL